MLSAESGEQALEMHRRARRPTSCCSTCGSPASTASQTLQRALALHPELAVLMMSAHSTVDIAVEAMKHGAIDFLVKPFPFQALDAAVERALATARTRRQIATLTERPAAARARSTRSSAARPRWSRCGA